MAIKLNGGGSVTTASPVKQDAPPPQTTNNTPQTQTAPTPPRPTFTPVRREQGNRKEMVHHPDHYGGKENPYEVIKVIRAWNLSFSLGNTVKYVARAGRKDPAKRIEDLHKAMWYLQEEINNEYERSTK